MNTAQDLLHFLQDTINATQANDLVVFLFSGRGLTQEGRYWLATADARRAAQRTDERAGEWSWDKTYLVSLDDIAGVAKASLQERRFVAIYDAQFEDPVAPPRRFELMYEKHLESVRPAIAPTASEASAGYTRLVDFRSGDPIRQQVHIWAEGVVSHSPEQAAKCGSDAIASTARPSTARGEGEAKFASDLASWLVPLFTRGMTYRSLLRAAGNNCLARGPDKRPQAILVAQGDFDLPIFESGSGLEDLIKLKDGMAFREFNIKEAYQIAVEGDLRNPDPLVSLSKAVFGVTLAEHEERFSTPLQAEKKKEWIESAIAAAEKVNDTKDRELARIQVDVLTRALIIKGEEDRARKLILSRMIEPTFRFTPVLVERLSKLTQDAMKTQPGILDQLEQAKELIRTREKLPVRQVTELIEKERSAAREPYRIRPALARALMPLPAR